MKQQPVMEVYGILAEAMSIDIKGLNVRLLDHLLLYTELQFRKEVSGEGSEREYSRRVDCCDKDIVYLHAFNSALAARSVHVELSDG
jgi:hypothetical protein